MPVGCRMKNAVADVGSQLALDTNHCWEDFKKPWRIPDSFGLDWESFSCGTLRWRLINTAAIINAWAVHELLHGFIGLGLRWGMSCKIQWRQIGLWMAYDLSPVYLDTWIGFHLFFFHPFHTQVLRQRRFMHWAFVSCGVRILRLSLARWWASKGTLTQVVTFLCGNFSQTWEDRVFECIWSVAIGHRMSISSCQIIMYRKFHQTWDSRKFSRKRHMVPTCSNPKVYKVI